MSGAIVAGAVIGVAGSAYAAKEGAKGAEEAAGISAEAQGESLAYLKEVEKLPRSLREEALRGLGGEVGFKFSKPRGKFKGTDGSTMEERALASPMYTGARDAGAENIMRHASMTGGMRSGNTQDALYRSDAGLFQNAYQQQQNLMSGLAGLPSYASEIAGVTSGIGETQAAGVMGAAGAMQQGYQGMGDAITGGVDNWLKYKASI